MLSDRCLSVTLVYFGQTVGWIKMPLGREAGLDPSNIVLLLDGDPASLPQKKGAETLRKEVGISPDDIVG